MRATLSLLAPENLTNPPEERLPKNWWYFPEPTVPAKTTIITLKSIIHHKMYWEGVCYRMDVSNWRELNFKTVQTDATATPWKVLRINSWTRFVALSSKAYNLGEYWKRWSKFHRETQFAAIQLFSPIVDIKVVFSEDLNKNWSWSKPSQVPQLTRS